MKLKRKLRKVIALVCVLSLSLSFSVLTGCQKTNQSGADGLSSGQTGNKTLNIAVFEGGYGSEIWHQVSKMFEEANPGVKVKITASPKLGDVIRPNLVQQKDVPDFIYLSSTNESGILQSLIGSNSLTDLSDVFTDDLKAEMLDGALDGPTLKPYGDGKIYAAPLFYSVLGMWYDKNLFKTNGWEVPTTWDEFFALGDKAKEKGLGLYTYAAANAPGYNESVAWPTVANATNNTKPLENVFNYKEGAWKSESVKKTLDIFTKIKDGKYLLDGTLGMNHTQSEQQLLLDKVLFLPCGTWLQGEMKDTEKAKGFEYGFAGVPTFNKNEKPFVWTASEEMYIPKAAANPDLAKKFIKFLYDEDTVKVMAPVIGAFPPIKGTADLVKDSLDDATYDAYKSVETSFCPVSGSFVTTDKTELNIRKNFFRGITKILSGETTSDELVNKLEDESKQLATIVKKK